MRLGRIILASLTALAAYSYANSASQSMHPATADSLRADSLRLLQYVAPLLAAAGDLSSQSHVDETDPTAILPLQELNHTPYGSSLILLASFVAVDLVSRRHQRTLLRV
jgi:hypothetical protein